MLERELDALLGAPGGRAQADAPVSQHIRGRAAAHELPPQQPPRRERVPDQDPDRRRGTLEQFEHAAADGRGVLRGRMAVLFVVLALALAAGYLLVSR